MKPRAALVTVVVISGSVIASCGAFGEATTNADAAGADAAIAEAAVGCARPRVADDFEAPDLASIWDVPPPVPPASTVKLDTARAHGGEASLLVTLAPSKTSRMAFAALDLGPEHRRCPLTVSFAFQTERQLDPQESVAYFRIVLDDDAWVTLRIRPSEHVVLEDNTTGSPNEALLPLLATSGFTRLKLVYDASTSPARTSVTVGDAEPVVLTHQYSSASPRRLRFGGSHGSPGDKAFTTWTDDVVVE